MVVPWGGPLVAVAVVVVDELESVWSLAAEWRMR